MIKLVVIDIQRTHKRAAARATGTDISHVVDGSSASVGGEGVLAIAPAIVRRCGTHERQPAVIEQFESVEKVRTATADIGTVGKIGGPTVVDRELADPGFSIATVTAIDGIARGNQRTVGTGQDATHQHRIRVQRNNIVHGLAGGGRSTAGCGPVCTRTEIGGVVQTG